ncbi:MAG: hypothetical protein HGA54_06935 [Actinobacteria bacterium]|nr:hypothetical protein [Actinomycetota bacterium]
MQYYIDGYNVTKRDPATRDLPIDNQRTELERRMRIRGAALLGKATYAIVWDGAGGVGVAHDKGPEIHFTRMPTADDSIVSKVCGSQSRVGVVTSDTGLADRCRAVAQHGVDILPVERLFASAEPTRKSKTRTPMRRDIGTPANANEINRELKELWGIDD